MPKKFETREEWLLEAATHLSDMIAEKTDLKPSSRIYVSAGWPRRDRGGKVIGQCFPKKVSQGAHHLFISPTLSDRTQVLATLLHELVHAADDCASERGGHAKAHMGDFTKAIRALGLEGKPTATVAGKALAKEFGALVKEHLGPYPHSVLTPGDYGPMKPQTTRQLKVVCPDCGCIVRMTRKWLDEIGPPYCGCTARGHAGSATQMEEEVK